MAHWVAAAIMLNLVATVILQLCGVYVRVRNNEIGRLAKTAVLVQIGLFPILVLALYTPTLMETYAAAVRLLL